MNRYSAQPHLYASLEDLQYGLLTQVRRFRKACAETSAVINLNGPVTPRKPVKAQSTDKLELMQSQIVLLRSMKGQLLTGFPSDARAVKVAAQVDALLTNIEQQHDTLLDQLSDASRETMDSTIRNRNVALARELQAELKSNVKEMHESYLTGLIRLPNSTDMPLGDVAYIHMEDLRDDSGYVYPNFYIMTCHPRATVDSKGRKLPAILIAVSPTMRVPSKIHWDATAAKPIDMRKVVMQLLVQDNVIGKATQRNIPIDRDKISFVHNNVARTMVQGDVITVYVKNPDELEHTSHDLQVQLQAIVRRYDPKNRDAIKVKLNRDKATIQLIFGLPGKVKGRILPNVVMTKIQQMLALTPAEMQRIKTALEDPK